MNEPAVLFELEELSRNANLGKFRHFEAAKRNKRYNSWVGVPIVCINIVLGSVFFLMISEEVPYITKLCGGFFAMVAALLGGADFF